MEVRKGPEHWTSVSETIPGQRLSGGGTGDTFEERQGAEMGRDAGDHDREANGQVWGPQQNFEQWLPCSEL